MRPTLLQFRSTKEKTPLSYDFRSTYDGRNLNFKSPKGDPKRKTFSCEKRFIAYDILAKRTGYRVGPGSYSPELYRPRIRSGSPYRELHGQKNTANNGYFMVGNVIEFEPELMLSSKKKIQVDKSITLDSTTFNTRFTRSSNNTTYRSVNVESPYRPLERPKLKFEKSNKQVTKKETNEGKKIQELIRKRFKN